MARKNKSLALEKASVDRIRLLNEIKDYRLKLCDGTYFKIHTYTNNKT